MAETQFPILIAEDDEDDRLLIADAFAEIGRDCDLHFVEDGAECLSYLRQIQDKKDEPYLVLLDLNMPKINGRETLTAIRHDQQLKHNAVVILSTSAAEKDVLDCYRLGANCYHTKPAGFQDWVGLCRQIYNYWLDSARLPKRPGL